MVAGTSGSSQSTCASAPPLPRSRPPSPSTPARPVPQFAAAAPSSAMSAAAAAFVPTFISFDDDDDFGEFEFAAAPASTSPPPPPNHAKSNQQQWQKTAGDEDDDWGDFVVGPFQIQPFGSPAQTPPSTSFFDPFPGPSATAQDLVTAHPVSPVAADKGWKKQSGALPLSLFGEEDEEDVGGEELSNSPDPQISSLEVGTFTSSKTVGSNGMASAQGEGLKDLIASLYGQANNVSPACAGSNDDSCENLKLHSSNGAKSDFPNGADDKEEELNENGWEFKDALDTPLEDAGDCVLVEKEDELAGVPGAEVKANDKGSRFQKEGKLAAISGVEGKATYNFTGSQHSDDCTLKVNGGRLNMFGSNLPSTVLNDGEWGNAFVSHDAVINGCNGSISDAHHNVEHGNIENRLSPNVISGDTTVDDSFWEFKDASSNTKTLSYFTESESIVHAGINELEKLHTSTCSNKNQDFIDSFPVAEGRQYESNLIVNGSENVDPCSAVGLHKECCNISTSKQSTLSSQDSSVSNETLKEPDRIVDFYSRLKQKSYTMALHHIENIKRASEEEVVGEEPEAGYLDGKIKAAFSKLGIVATESDYLEKSPNDLTVYDLLEVLQNPCFQAFDMEYSLSTKIQMAAKDWTSAMWLFEHASYILRILRLASYEEQRTYIISWSKLVAACERELQHGAVIWSKARRANIQKELLSEFQGQQYFLALGEMYRVIEILSASVRLYKAWIFLNPADSSVFLNCIMKSLEAWKDSALKQALEIISESLGELKVVAEELLESLTYISQLSVETLHNHLPNHETHFCRLCLLPLELLPDIKHLVWQGDHYFSKLANLWANRISCDAPQLPCVQVGQ